MKDKTEKVHLRVKLLGRFELERQGVRLSHSIWPRSKTLTLFKILVSERGRVFTQDQLIELLFFESPMDKALENLYRRVSEVRRVLEPRLKKGSQSRYILNVGQQGYCCNEKIHCWVDIEAFQASFEHAKKFEHSKDFQNAIAAYQDMLNFYEGDFLSEDLYEDWTQPHRARLQQLYFEAFLRQSQCYAHMGHFQQAIDVCQALILKKSTYESAYQQKIRYHSELNQPTMALHTYERCLNALKEELHVAPSSETKALYEKIVQQQTKTPSQKIRTNVPTPLTSFVGRDRELLEIKNLLTLTQTRLLTLTGFGGVGKTRLAQKIATELIESMPDGIGWVKLAELSDPNLVPQAVASALHVREEAGRSLIKSLIDFLSHKQLVLILDNCEHLITACAKLVEMLLENAPTLRILTTSREPLGVPGEISYLVTSFALPDLERLARGGIDLDVLSQYESVRLFLERAKALQPSFALTERNASVIAHICFRLDGIPLALELAAAKVKVLSVEQIAERLEHGFQLLTAPTRTALPKEQTLRAAMDWSYQLLTPAQAVLFHRLSVYNGGSTLAAVESVCAREPLLQAEILETLTQLIDKSLLFTEEQQGVTRYRMLNTIHQYARERLTESGEYDAFLKRHLNWFVALAEQAETQLLDADQTLWLKRLDEDYDNFRAALRWSLERDEDEAILGLRLVGALGPFWLARSHLDEGSHRLEAALPKAPTAPDSIKAKALLWLGTIARHLGDYQKVLDTNTRSLELYQNLGDAWGTAFSLRNLGAVAQHEGYFLRATTLHQESLKLARLKQDAWSIAWSLHNLGVVARDQGDYERVMALCTESLTLFRQWGDTWAVATSLHYLGEASYHRHDYTTAENFLRESLLLYRELGDKRGMTTTLRRLGANAVLIGQYERAVMLLSATPVLRESLDRALTEADIAEVENNLGSAREKLGLTEFTQAQTLGKNLSLADAVTLALKS